MLGGYFSTLAYVKWVEKSDDAHPITDLDDYVTRSDVETSLRNILTPPKFNNYWIVCGEHGTGKTTTVQKVCQEIGKGIIYVNVPEDAKDFQDAFVNAIGLTHRHNGGILTFVHQSVYGREALPRN